MNSKLTKAKAALKVIDPDCDHDKWVQIGMALKSEFTEDEAYEAFENWSKTGEKYDPETFATTWASIGEKAETGDSISIGTLFYHARENGYKTGSVNSDRQTIVFPAQKIETETPNVKIKAEKAKKDTAAMVKKAMDYWISAAPDLPHPYATKKGFQTHGLRIKDDRLLVPAYNANHEIQSIQRINEKDKLNLKGCTISGCYYPIKGDKQKIVVVEGWATGMSINEATGYAVAVAFGKGNLIRIAGLMRLKYPTSELIVAADSDHVETANEAAAACSGSLAVPVKAKGGPDLDFNDMHLLQGLESVKAVFAGALEKPEPERAKPDRPGKISFTPADQITLEPIDWLVNKYFEKNAITFLYGDTQSFKTFICLNLALSVATGADWIPGIGVSQGSVLYVCGEGRQGIRRRLEAWSLHHNNKTIPSNLLISDMSTDLANEERIKELVEAIDAMETKPAVICIDTLARNFGAGESSNDDIGLFYSNVEKHLVKRYGCAVLTTHHPGKNHSQGMRGASSLKQNADGVYKVARHDIDGEAYTTLSNEKMKDAGSPDPITFKAIKIDLKMQDSFGGESSSLVLEHVPDLTQLRKSLNSKVSTTDKAESDRKKLLTLIDQDGTLTQQAYATQCGFNSQQVVSSHLRWLRKQSYVGSHKRNLKVTPKGKAWIAPEKEK